MVYLPIKQQFIHESRKELFFGCLYLEMKEVPTVYLQSRDKVGLSLAAKKFRLMMSRIDYENLYYNPNKGGP